MRVLEGVNLNVADAEILGIVGESGSGKSVTALSIMRLLRRPGRVTGGRALFRGVDLLELGPREMRAIRGDMISMIFQSPRSSLNPVFPVGKVLREVLRSTPASPAGRPMRGRWSCSPTSGFPIRPRSFAAIRTSSRAAWRSG